MTDQISATFAALADPIRRAMLARLAEGEATVAELAAPHAMSLPSISRHLAVLERAGLVSTGRNAQWRPRRLEPAGIKAADDWLAPFREFFESRFDRLEEHVRSMAEATADTSGTHPSGTPATSTTSTDPTPQEGRP